MSDRWRPALAGVAAVAVALAVSELLAAAVDGIPSLVTSVGSVLIPVVPPALESWAIRTFGTSDKAVLNTGTTVITLVVGAWAGVKAHRRFPDGATIILLFAAIGMAAALLQPLTSPVLVVASVVIAGAAAVATLRALLRTERRDRADREAEERSLVAAPAVGESPTDVRPTSRRRFLVASAGSLGAALAVTGAARAIRSARTLPEAAVTSIPEPVTAAPPIGPANRFADVEGLSPIVVPNDEFYRIDTALTVPRIDVAEWSLRVTGMVDREIELSYADLRNLPLVEKYVTLSCVSNEVGGDLVGNALWTGVRLTDVLDRAGVHAGAGQIVGRSVDGWTAGFPTELAYDGREPLIAIAMNGDPLPARHGFPARLVVPGLYGYVSATKWLSEIELTTWDGFDAYWVPRGWSKEGQVKTQSRIDRPRGNSTVLPGATVVAGVAWAPDRGIEKVEVRVDDGEWLPCEVTAPLSDDAWVQWRIPLELTRGEHLVSVRATDGLGRTQTDRFQPPRPDGATGHHTIRLRVEAA